MSSPKRILLAGWLFFSGFAGAVPAAAPAAVTPALPPGARIVPERSGEGHDTWDLGFDPAQPGRRRYALAIRQPQRPPEVRLPGRLGEAPVVWTLPDGRRVEWSFQGAAQLLAEFPEPAAADRPDVKIPALFAPEGASAVRREGDGHHFQLRPPPAGVMATTLRLDPGLRVELAEMPFAANRTTLRIRDEKSAVLEWRVAAPAQLIVEDLGGGIYSLSLSADSGARASGGPGTIDAYIVPTGTWGGWQCLINGNPNTAGNGNPYPWLYTGMWAANYPCNSYMLWDLAPLPATATATGVWLYPIYANTHAGAAQTIFVRDIDKNRTLTSTAGYAASLAYFNDFGAMYGGHADYGSFTVTGVGNYYPELNAQALADLNDRKRTLGYFAVGLSGSATAPGNYDLFTTNSSTLWIYYSDYAPHQIVVNHLHHEFGSTNDEVDLYNNDEAIDIGGWQIKSHLHDSGYSTVPSVYTIPANTVIPRHGRVRVISGVGVNDPANRIFYTGDGFTFYWFTTGTTTQIEVYLLRADATGADYVCWLTGLVPAPPSGTTWTGPCINGQPNYNSNVARILDSDTDAAADWAFNVAPTALPPPLFNAGQFGSRRRSEVFFNHFLVYPGYNWISIANYGPPVDLVGWKLEIWSGQATYGSKNGTFIFPAGVVGTGQVVWLAEGGYFGSPDILHRNLGFAVGWYNAPQSGYAVLRDSGGRGRDFIAFGQARDIGGGNSPEALPAELIWTGSLIPVPSGASDMIRDSDINSQSATGWVQGPLISNWGLLGPNAFGPSRHQDEAATGTDTASASILHWPGPTGPYGVGEIIAVTRPVGLEEFALEAAPDAGPASATLVVKSQSSGTIIFTRSVTISEVNGAPVSTGRIAPPIVLTPGNYAFMLYVNGVWRDAMVTGSTEALSFGTHAGWAYEAGFTPTAGFAINTGWSIHSFYSTVNPPVISSPGALPFGEATAAYGFNHTATGGYGAYAWTVTAGSLPPGLGLTAGGALSGTPTLDGVYPFTVRVTDAAGLYSEQAETLQINPRLQVATSLLPDYDSFTAPYSFTLTAYGGVAPFAWSCSGLPAGLSCAGGGVLSGIAGGGVTDGLYSFTAQVTDSFSVTASRPLNLRIYKTPQILTSSLAAGYRGVDYGLQKLIGAGGSGSASWSVISGALPSGLTLDPAAGTITGIPTNTGVYSLTLQYSTTTGGSASRAFTITVSVATVPPYWIRKGLAGGSLWPHFSPNFVSDQTVVGSTNGGNVGLLYISRDGGYFWKSMNLKLQQVTLTDAVSRTSYENALNSVAFSPDFNAAAPASGSNRTLVVATEASGVWYSDDFDQSWTQLNTGLDGSIALGLYEATDVFFSPNYPSDHRLYCRSFDRALGAFGIFTGVVNTVSKTISWSRVTPDWLQLGTASDNLSNFNYFMSPAFASDSTFYAQVPGPGNTTRRLYRSQNGGVSWQLTYTHPSNIVMSVKFSPNFGVDQTLGFYNLFSFYGAGGPIYLSADGGLSFLPRGAAFNLASFEIPPTYDATTNPDLYAIGKTAAGFQMVRSEDNGATFTATGMGGLPANQLLPYLFFVSPGFATDSSLVVAGTGDIGLFRTVNGGASWGPSDGGLYLKEILAVAFAPNYAASGRAFLATDGGLFYSTNQAKAWRKATIPDPAYQVESLQPSPNFASDQTVFAYTCKAYNDCKLWRSTDGGVNYTVRSVLQYNIQRPEDFQISPNFAADQTLFYNFGPWTNNGLWRSIDGGATFTPQGPPATYGLASALSPGFASDSTLYFTKWGYTNPLIRGMISTNASNPDGGGGVTLTPFSGTDGFVENPPAFPPQYNRVSGVDGLPSHTFFWNCKKTTTAGATWSALPAAGPGCGSGGGIVVSPNYSSDQTLFSYVEGADALNPGPGLYKSSNGGGSFSGLTAAGNPSAFYAVQQVALSPAFATDRTVLVATDTGLMVSRDGGTTWSQATGSEAISPDVSAVSQDPNQTGGLFVGTLGGEVFQSTDDGISASLIRGTLPAQPVNGLQAADAGGGITTLLAANATGIYRTSFDAGHNWSGLWSLAQGGNFKGFTAAVVGATPTIYAANAAGNSYQSTNAGASWSSLGSQVNDGAAITYSANSGPTFLTGSRTDPKRVAGNQASLWSASGATGAWYSLNSGASWIAAPGGNDYTLPAASGWSSVLPLGINAAAVAREVLIGHSAQGVFRSLDGGVTWRNASGPGSGLEGTSKVVSTFLAATTAYGTTDVLVGINGSTTGGVYQSGDGGEHWQQINQGFDPSALNISTLVKTSCAGCPVQYYSGTYGSGVYTRTIPVNNPPTVTGWCFTGTSCTCNNTNPLSGPEQGGQGFKLCGGNYLALPAVEFDGVAASGCSMVSASVITCTGTPPHVPGVATLRVRNTDTRPGYPKNGGGFVQPYTYTGGVPRVIVMKLYKIGAGNADVRIDWTCTGCATTPPHIYRSQNLGFTQYLEHYTGATGASGTYTNTGALAPAANPSYFWTIE